MSALADQQFALVGARSRLGMPVTPIKHLRRPVTVPISLSAETPKPEARPIRIGRAHWSSILREVSVKHNIDTKTLLGPARYREAVAARNEAYYRIRHEVQVLGKPMSLPEIGRRFGKDHTSVLYGVRQHAKKLVEAV